MSRRGWIVLCVAIGLAGCDAGPQMVDVAGTIKLNGQPIDKIHVEFWPVSDGPRSIGVTDAQGNFTLTSDDGKRKGAVVGKHKVVLKDIGIMKDEFLGRAAETLDTSEGRKPRIADLYSDPHKSPLSADVTTADKAIELAVEPAPAQ